MRFACALSGSVERGVREGDRACHAGKSAACASDAEAGGEQEDRRAARVIGPAAAQEALLADAASVAPRQQRRQREPRQHQIPVLGHELPDELQRIVVVGEEDLVGREAFLRVAEIDRIGEIRGHDEQAVYRDVIAEEQVAVPAPFPQVQGQERQQDEQPVGIDHRGRVEEQRPPRSCRSPVCGRAPSWAAL